ncbi:MAG: Holliday junction resolvase RuvX [Pirellulales bacterium]
MTESPGPEMQEPFGNWPAQGRIAGIDYGTVRIGVAICDPSRTWTSPLTTYERKTPIKDGEFFQKLAKDEQVAAWVLGLPIHCDGNESVKSVEVRAFAKWLCELTKLPIRFVDERFSTAFASQLLRPAELTRKQTKKRVDRVAALVILESYLEQERHGIPYSLPAGLDERRS